MNPDILSSFLDFAMENNDFLTNMVDTDRATKQQMEFEEIKTAMLKSVDKNIQANNKRIKEYRDSQIESFKETAENNYVSEVAFLGSHIFHEMLKSPAMVMNLRTFFLDKDPEISQKIRNLYKKEEYIDGIVKEMTSKYDIEEEQTHKDVEEMCATYYDYEGER